jgi:hypothetical protein
MRNTGFAIPGIGPVATELTDDMKLCNSDISLDDAVADLIESGEEFIPPNLDLLIEAVNDTPRNG